MMNEEACHFHILLKTPGGKARIARLTERQKVCKCKSLTHCEGTTEGWDPYLLRKIPVRKAPGVLETPGASSSDLRNLSLSDEILRSFFYQIFAAACDGAFTSIIMAVAIFGGSPRMFTFFNHLQFHPTSFAHINFALSHFMTRCHRPHLLSQAIFSRGQKLKILHNFTECAEKFSRLSRVSRAIFSLFISGLARWH